MWLSRLICAGTGTRATAHAGDGAERDDSLRCAKLHLGQQTRPSQRQDENRRRHEDVMRVER